MWDQHGLCTINKSRLYIATSTKKRLTGEEIGAEKLAAVLNLIRKSDCSERQGVNSRVNERLVLQHSCDEMSSESGKGHKVRKEGVC